ncbi:hypothetical protein NKDENANG_00761 [Candidatus Entotheonellaceae bacterium PAL068K]
MASIKDVLTTIEQLAVEERQMQKILTTIEQLKVELHQMKDILMTIEQLKVEVRQIRDELKGKKPRKSSEDDLYYADAGTASRAFLLRRAPRAILDFMLSRSITSPEAARNGRGIIDDMKATEYSVVWERSKSSSAKIWNDNIKPLMEGGVIRVGDETPKPEDETK